MTAITLSSCTSGHPHPETIPYKWLQGPELLLRRFVPEDHVAGQARAAVILIHGGAWRFGTPDLFFTQARYFASRGMVAFTVNYRLFAAERSTDGAGLATCIADCRSAIRFIRARASALGVDPRRIAVVGDSAGGYLAGATALVPIDDPKDDRTVSATPDAMVLCNPITDLTEGDWIRSVIAGEAFSEPQLPLLPTPRQVEVARSLSLLHQVRVGLPPALVLHGLDDRIVVPEHARAFAAAMAAAGNRCDLELIPGARHAFVLHGYTATPEQVVSATRRIDAFLSSLGFLQGEPTLAP